MAKVIIIDGREWHKAGCYCGFCFTPYTHPVKPSEQELMRREEELQNMAIESFTASPQRKEKPVKVKKHKPPKAFKIPKTSKPKSGDLF